jgi:transcriptional regulator with XRE-family HTH domain
MEPGFGARLRQQRERQHVELSAIASETKITLSLLEGLERDDVSHWPGGIFRKAFVRAYAQAIGMNPDDVVREFLERYPDETELVTAVPSVSPTGNPVFPRRKTADRLRDRVHSVYERGLAFLHTDASTPVVTDDSARDVAAAMRSGRAEPNLSAVARLCTALGRVLSMRDAVPLLADASRTIGAVGVLVWRWESRSAVLRPSIGHGYSDAVLAHIPDVARDADNAVAASFRAAQTCVVSGGAETTGAVAIPLMVATGCIGVLALEFRNGGEQLESVRAVATVLAAQLAQLLAHGSLAGIVKG